MGNPGRRRRPGRRRWLRALISRGRPSQEAATGLLAEPAEFRWPGHSGTERQSGDPAAGWPADPAVYQWLGDWPDEPDPRRLLDGLPEPDWPAEPAARSRFAGHGPGPGLHGRRRAGWPDWLGRVAQQDWSLALARYRWYVAISAGAGAMALASAVILLLPHQPGRAMMADARPVPGASRSRPASTAPSQQVASPSARAGPPRSRAAGQVRVRAAGLAGADHAARDGKVPAMTDRQELEALSSQELHDRAVRRAVHHLDIGFLWQLLREIPAGEAVAGHIDETAADVTQLSATIDDAFGHESPEVADALRPLYLDYLEKQNG